MRFFRIFSVLFWQSLLQIQIFHCFVGDEVKISCALSSPVDRIVKLPQSVTISSGIPQFANCFCIRSMVSAAVFLFIWSRSIQSPSTINQHQIVSFVPHENVTHNFRPRFTRNWMTQYCFFLAVFSEIRDRSFFMREEGLVGFGKHHLKIAWPPLSLPIFSHGPPL